MCCSDSFTVSLIVFNTITGFSQQLNISTEIKVKSSTFLVHFTTVFFRVHFTTSHALSGHRHLAECSSQVAIMHSLMVHHLA